MRLITAGLFFIVAIYIGNSSIAQPKFERFGESLYGEAITSVLTFDNSEEYAATANTLYYKNTNSDFFQKIWETPFGRSITYLSKPRNKNSI